MEGLTPKVVLDLRVDGYDNCSNKVDPSCLNPAWDSSDNSVGELSSSSGPAVKVKLKAPGTCFIHVKQGTLKATAGIEVFVS